MNDEIGYREEIRTNLPRPTAISWGAILAGLFATLGVSWLLYLFGIAVGVSVADASDDMLLDDGLPQAVALWMVLSAAAAYFIGAALTSRMAAVADETVGMLHGLTLWGVATVATLLFAYCGVTTLLQTGQGFVAGAGTAVVNTASAGVSATAAGAAGIADGAQALADTDLADSVRTELKDRVAEAVASVDADDAEVSEEDVKQAIEDLDEESFDELVANLTDDDQEAAAALIADSTSLSSEQAEALIEGAYNELKDQLGVEDGSLVDSVRKTLIDQTAQAVAAFDAKGQTTVSASEVRKALRSLDREAFNAITEAAMASDWEEVQDLIVAETNLSDDETEEIVRGVKRAYRSRIKAATTAASEAVETTSTYAAQILWTTFAASAIGLAVSILGGWCGVEANKRLYYEVHEKPVTS